MEPGQTLYRYRLHFSVSDFSQPIYRETATATGIVLDGMPMVRIHDLLLTSDGWHETERDAKAAVIPDLVRAVGRMQVVIDRLKDEVQHETLTADEVTT